MRKKQQITEKDELEYVGLIEDSIGYREDIRAIEVCLKSLI